MARRRKSSPAEDLMELIALLPWWAGIGLAIISYLVLSSIAAKPLVFSGQPNQVGPAITASILKSLAMAGQYILPIIFLCSAALSAHRRYQRKQLVNDVAQPEAADALDGMHWQHFEMLVGEAFRLQGFQVIETGGGGADGGVDLVLSKPSRNGREKYLVQCKQWRALKVGVDVIRELYGVMAARGATGGFVVTSGRFTDEASKFAEGRNVRLIDGPRLQRMIREVRGTASWRPQPNASATASQTTTNRGTNATAPSCPKCGKTMLRRTAKRGVNVGGAFWGCIAYPACRGTRSIE